MYNILPFCSIWPASDPLNILTLQLTGVKSLANQYVNSLKQQCESKASTKPGGGDDGVKDKLCPNDCSQHGTCVRGRLSKDSIFYSSIHISYM